MQVRSFDNSTKVPFLKGSPSSYTRVANICNQEILYNNLRDMQHKEGTSFQENFQIRSSEQGQIFYSGQFCGIMGGWQLLVMGALSDLLGMVLHGLATSTILYN